MAKAHQAAHSNENHDKEVLELLQNSRSWKKWMKHINRKLHDAVYPAHVESFWIISMLVMALHFASIKVPFDLVNKVAGNLPR